MYQTAVWIDQLSSRNRHDAISHQVALRISYFDLKPQQLWHQQQGRFINLCACPAISHMGLGMANGFELSHRTERSRGGSSQNESRELSKRVWQMHRTSWAGLDR